MFSSMFRIASIPPQGVFHCLLIMGSYHHISISVERYLIQHVVQTPFSKHRHMQTQKKLNSRVVFD